MRTDHRIAMALSAVIGIVALGIAGCADRAVISPDDPAYNAMGAPSNPAGTDPAAASPYHPLGNDEEQ